MKKARFFYFHEESNKCKIHNLELLHTEYRRYLQSCIDSIINSRRVSISKKEMIHFFPKENVLSTQIVISCQLHAMGIISGWYASLYERKIKKHIKKLAFENIISDSTKIELFTIGKYDIDKPTNKVNQENINLYWSFLLNDKLSGRTPIVSNRVEMRFSVNTCTVRKVESTELTAWWFGFSNLNRKKRIQIPIKPSPFVKSVKDIQYGVSVRKDRRGHWRIEVLERKEYISPSYDENFPKLGVDVGLNVIAATSNGRLFGENFKPKFDKLYDKIRSIRSNRQRQNLKINSIRLGILEDKLSGMIKTCTGEISNKLIHDFPNHTFVIEDLNLRGCKGQKRFAYRLLHKNLIHKASVQVVNPAYTSQMCPSCLYVSKLNRKGVSFVCQSCGRISHADVIGGINLLGRSEDELINSYDHPSEVRSLLKERYFNNRNNSLKDSSSIKKEVNELVSFNKKVSSNRKLTVKVNSVNGNSAQLQIPKEINQPRNG